MIGNECRKVLGNRWYCGFFLFCLLVNYFFAFHFVSTDALEEQLAPTGTPWSSAGDYEVYKRDVIGHAENSIGIFAISGQGTYAVRNAEKTKEHFQNMGSIEIRKGPQEGVLLFFSPVTAGLVFFSLMLAGYLLFLQERENGIQSFLAITRNGRYRLGLAKWCAHLFLTAGVTAVFYGMNFLILLQRYGFGDWTRSIQSVYSYRSAGSAICVWEFLVYGILLLLLLFSGISAVLDIFFVFIGNSVKSFVLIVTLSVAFFGICIRTPRNSACHFAKYLNPFFCYDMGELLGKYTNLNLAGYPVGYVPAYLVLFGVLFLAGSAVLMGVFVRRPSGRKGRVEKRREAASGDSVSGVLSSRGSVSLFRHEWYQIRKRGHLVLIVAAACAVSIFCACNTELIFNDEDEYYYYSYMKQLEGVQTDEKIRFLQMEKARLLELKKQQADALAEGDTDTVLAYGEKLRCYNGFCRAEERSAYLEKNHLPYYIYEGGLERFVLLRGNDFNVNLLFLGILCVVLVVSPVFAMEREQERMYLLTEKGRKERYCLRIGIALLICTFFFCLIWVPQWVRYERLYEFTGLSKSISYIGKHSLFGDGISIRLWLVLHGLLRFLVLAGSAGLTLFLSRRTRNEFIAIMVMCFFSVAGYLVMM